MASRTRWRVEEATSSGRLSTLLTVPMETPARRATSLMPVVLDIDLPRSPETCQPETGRVTCIKPVTRWKPLTPSRVSFYRHCNHFMKRFTTSVHEQSVQEEGLVLVLEGVSKSFG